MKSKYIFLINVLFFSTLLILPSSCHKDLEVENPNNPDREKAYSDPADVMNIASDGFFNWFMTMNSSLSPRIAMWVAADQGTCSWLNSGMYDLSYEPRKPFNNDVSYTYANIFSRYYSDMYGTLNTMNQVLKKANEGMKFGYNGSDTKMVKAYSYFIQGITLGYLGLVYDKAMIVTENTVDPEASTFQPYSEVIDSAIVRLQKSIAISDKAHFKIPDTWINGKEYDEDELIELANSFMARFLVYKARNKQQNSETDWAKVLEYANNGIKNPLVVHMDNTKWYCYYKHYTTSREGWARIDCRIINLMDPTYPSRFPETGINPPAASSDDERLGLYFSFTSSNNMKPERGYVHYSNYEFSRYTYDSADKNGGDVEPFTLAENDLIKAEANAMLGNLDEAISIINAGTRTTVGKIAPLPASATKEEVLEAIFYERDIELIQTGFGIAFFDMRRRDFLQEGTLLHFPVPGRELSILSEPIYSFGGVSNADGVNTSNGGWDK